MGWVEAKRNEHRGEIRSECEQEFNQQSLKAIYRFNIVPYQNSNGIFQNSNAVFHRNSPKIVLKLVWNHQRPQLAKIILRKYNELRGMILC